MGDNETVADVLYTLKQGSEIDGEAADRIQAAHAREVEALRLRAEAAEGAMRTVASTQEGRMAIAKAIHIELDKVDAWLDAAIASVGDGQK